MQVHSLVLIVTARDRFEQTRRYVIELGNIQALISEGGDDWKPDDVHGGGISDPTASRACYNVDVWGERLEQLRERERELIDFIGTTLAIIEAVRRGLGDDYADILDQRYIDGLRWCDVLVDGEPVTLSTGKRKAAIAFDWIDSIGLTGILKGDYEL